nr:hypothetical protein Itr_chr11CG08410 [Ipomoea trifida]
MVEPSSNLGPDQREFFDPGARAFAQGGEDEAETGGNVTYEAGVPVEERVAEGNITGALVNILLARGFSRVVAREGLSVLNFNEASVASRSF